MPDVGHSSDSQVIGVNKKLIGIISVLVVLVIAALIFIIVLLTRETPTETPAAVSTGGRGTVITEDNVEEFQPKDEPVQDGYYTTSMSIDWHFDGKVSKDAYVANITQNTRTVYFDLFLADTGEMIYTSPYIPVGKELKGLELTTELEPGTYETILVYHLVDDEEKELSTLSIALTIYVN